MYKFKIQETLHSPPLFTIEIESEKWLSRYDEATRRFCMCDKMRRIEKKSEEEVQEYLKKNPTYEVDEVEGCEVMSPIHLKAMIDYLNKFLKNENTNPRNK